MKIFLIDGIGPFFRRYEKRQINWSKIPFHNLDKETDVEARFEQISMDMEVFAQKVSAVGYNSISLDDVAHLTTDIWLEPEMNARITLYQNKYRTLFAICKRYGLNIYLTMDILSMTPALKDKIAGKRERAMEFLLRQTDSVLAKFPDVKGLILRIGECDGKDVKGAFRSELILHTPRQVNRMIHDLMPIFEKHNRTMILRSWTVGAHKVGDLIWHRRTISRVLRGVDSPNFVMSLKYGESDFFRYLPLNKHFFRLKVKKIIELQARREYEGCGEYPSFIGWDYNEYADQLKSVENMTGISVWCQTGGWVPFRRLSYLQEEGIWNELNSYLCIKIFKEHKTVEEGIHDFADTIGCEDSELLTEFLHLNDAVIKDLLYIEEVAGQKLFFRRVRIPPLLSVFWDNIFINHSVRKLLRILVSSGEESVNKGYLALEKIEKMESIARELNLPDADIRYMYDTFSLLVLARKYYFLPYSDALKKRILKAKKRYKKTYPKESRPRYRMKTNFTPFTLRRYHLKWILQISLRKKRGYRVVDYLITMHLLAIVYRIIVFVKPDAIPKFARKKAMGIEAIFK